MENKRNEFLLEKGITLVALVVTIIVLLILAGISISMLAGDSSILQKATDAKEQTDIASIKEQAELVKIGLQVDTYSRKNSESIKQNALVSAIHKEFSGSTYKGNKVTTSDNKYDIIIDADLNIEVVKHVDVSNGEILLAYEFYYVKRDGEYLRVIPTLPGEYNVPEYDVWAQLELDKLSTDSTTRQQQLEEMFVEADKYYFARGGASDDELAQARSITSFSDWMAFMGESCTNINDFKQSYGSDHDSVEDMMIDWIYVKPQEYEEKNNTTSEITITCGEESYTINLSEQSYADFYIDNLIEDCIENGSEYRIMASATDENQSTGEATLKIISPRTVTVEEGTTSTLRIQGNNEALIWNSSDESVATVNDKGEITGISKGTATITATNESGTQTSNLCTVTVKSIIGDYVEYGIGYTDVYSDDEFTSTTGWRVLDPGTRNADGTYSNTKIISTGIPAILYYHMNTNKGNKNDIPAGANDWWGTKEQVTELYGAEIANKGYSNPQGISNSGVPSYYAITGLRKNFSFIPFAKQTSTPAENSGRYTKITINGAEESGNITGSSFLLSSVASEVHNLTLEELNKARGLSVTSTKETTQCDGDTGLFFLKNLDAENKLEKDFQIKYNYNTNYAYWIANPRW